MGEKLKIDGVLDRSADLGLFASDWWQENDGRLLPGEAGGVTVFVVEFQDGCRYLGHTDPTDSSVFERMDDLVASPLDERRSVFVAEHCARMGSVVRCIASNLDVAAAAALRDELVLKAPDVMRKVDEASLEARECFLAEVATEPVRMSFAEWVKTREEGEIRWSAK